MVRAVALAFAVGKEMGADDDLAYAEQELEQRQWADTNVSTVSPRHES
jgi:hypothetical protein